MLSQLKASQVGICDTFIYNTCIHIHIHALNSEVAETLSRSRLRTEPMTSELKRQQHRSQLYPVTVYVKNVKENIVVHTNT